MKYSTISSKSKLQVTTRDRYREQVRLQAYTMHPNPNKEVIERWTERQLAEMEKQGRLVTETQYRDKLRGRLLREGDRVRYIGPDRDETLPDGRVVHRPNGQTGSIVEVTPKGRVTFRPDAPAPVARIVDLVVMTDTPGYYTLERQGAS